MFSDRIDARIKGFTYAAESARYIQQVDASRAWFRGSSTTHLLRKAGDEWTCDCDYFRRQSRNGLAAFCAHTIAIERAQAINANP